MTRDQASQLRQLVSQRQTAGGALVALVAVSGGLSGVGTTTVAMNLAVALARQGRRTVLVDADLAQGGQLAERMESGSVLDVLSGRRGVHEVLARGPLGVQVLNGGVAVPGSLASSAAAHGHLISQLRGLAPYAEVVVIDAGHQRCLFQERLWQEVDTCCVVTSGADAAILAGYALLKTIASNHTCPPLFTFVNRADETRAADVHSRMAEACERFLKVRLGIAGSIGQVPSEDRDSHGLIEMGSSAAWNFDSAAETLWSQLERTSRPPAAPARAMQHALS